MISGFGFRSIRTKVLVVGLAAMVLAGLVGLFVAFAEHQELQEEFVANAISIGRQTAFVMGPLIAFESQNEMRKALEVLRSNPDVTYAQVADEHGAPVASVGRVPRQPCELRAGLGSSTRAHTFQVVTPIVDGGKTWGCLALGVSLERTEHNAKRVWQIALVSGAFTMFATLLGGFYLSRSIAEPIRRLADAASRVAQGDWKAPIDLSSRDEVGVLARSFCTMLEELRSSEQQLQSLAGSLLTAQENERRRLSRELHDDITQRLAFLSIELGKLAGKMPASTEEVQARIRALQEQTFQVSAEVRRLSHGLHPSVIEDFGLSIALEEFCDEFARAQGIDVSFEGLVEDSRLDAAGATCLYRVAQESLRNALVHGHATEVCVSLTTDAEAIHLRVRDNGRGFATNSTREKTGLGSISMRERVRLVDGMLTLSSQPGKGTEVSASVPLAEGGRETSAHFVG